MRGGRNKEEGVGKEEEGRGYQEGQEEATISIRINLIITLLLPITTSLFPTYTFIFPIIARFLPIPSYYYSIITYYVTIFLSYDVSSRLSQSASASIHLVAH